MYSNLFTHIPLMRDPTWKWNDTFRERKDYENKGILLIRVKIILTSHYKMLAQFNIDAPGVQDLVVIRPLAKNGRPKEIVLAAR